MHRIVKAADARVKENGHRNLVTGHRTSNYNSGNLKSLDGGISHEGAENSSAKSSNEKEISHGRVSWQTRSSRIGIGAVGFNERLCEKYFRFPIMLL